LGWNPLTQQYDPGKLEEFDELVKQRCEQLLSGDDYADNLKVFIKLEPHKTQKLIDGRLRLISAVSLIDAMVDRIIFGWLHRKIMENFGQTPIMIGWTPLNGGWRLIDYNKNNVVCVDKSSWDWTMQPWITDSIERVVLELGEYLPSEAKELIRVRFRLLFEKAKFEFLDSTVAEQRGRGIMKSGCFMTIAFNSIAQLLLHAVTNLQNGKDLSPWPKCLGDDTIQPRMEDLDTYVATMSKLGVKLKVTEGEVEFAGFRFAPTGVFPSYIAKHMFKLKYTNNLPEELEAYQLLYGHSPYMTDILRKIAVSTGNSARLLSRRKVITLLG